MRLIHTSDWHLGRTLHGADLLPYQEEFLDWLLAESVAKRADAVIVAGDVYDRAVPVTDAVALLDRALTGFSKAGIQVLLTSGNHDSAIRLGFGSRLSEAAGVHLRTSVAEIARPLVVGDVGLYGIPYLLPDAVMAELNAERSHASVLAAAVDLIKKDAADRGIDRVVVAAHAFVTGAAPCESERDIRVGGIADVPASVFSGLTYVALGHLHGQQNVDQAGTIRYSGSPLAFSFGERHQAKSVTLAEIDASGLVTTTKLPAPVPRPLKQVKGTLDEVLSLTDPVLERAWVKVVLTDAVRPAAPMERLRERWPHTLVLDFAPEGELVAAEADLRRTAEVSDPVEICAHFVEFTSGGPPDEEQRAVLADVIETVQHADTEENGSLSVVPELAA
ncbi:MAG TPA: exonuclease SbcCD subunit D [Streptosporangiaceae bacterium]|nr:exonuclease SbcCD subunit D [Streptosporangiaceae bacterium]